MESTLAEGEDLKQIFMPRLEAMQYGIVHGIVLEMRIFIGLRACCLLSHASALAFLAQRLTDSQSFLSKASSSPIGTGLLKW